MYHPTRGGVRGGRDQFKWDDVKVDKHRENYLGHSIMAPVGRWQKGKDLHWYNRDKNSQKSDMEAAKDEIKRIKEQEEEAMREVLGLAPKRASRPQGNRLDKHEFTELVKRGSTAEDLGAGHSEAAQVNGLGFSRAPRSSREDSSSLQSSIKEVLPEKANVNMPNPSSSNTKEEESDDVRKYKKRRHEERKHEKHGEQKKRQSRDSDDKRNRRKDKEKRRHDSD